VRHYRFLQLDVFTDKAIRGQPTRSVSEAEGLSDEEMMQMRSRDEICRKQFCVKPKK